MTSPRPLTLVHAGVLIPTELQRAPIAELDAYADRVRCGNRAFRHAVFLLEDRAAELGVDLDAPRP